MYWVSRKLHFLNGISYECMQGRMIHPAGHSLSSYLHEVCANLKHNFSKKYGLPLLKVTFLLGQ